MSEYEIMQNKVDNMVGNNYANVKRSIGKFQTLIDSISDVIVKNNYNSQVISYGLDAANAPLAYIPGTDNSISMFNIHKNALNQMSSKFGVKSGVITNYLEGNEWERQLGVHILNEHSRNNKDRFLIRSVDGQIRGFLSDKYKRFDSGLIVSEFLVSGHKAGLVPVSSHISDTKVFFESIIPQVFTIETEKNGMIYVVYGIRISLSDFGNGALDVQYFMLNMVCTNGMTGEKIIRNIHRGSAIDENFEVSAETFRLETAARTSAIRDIFNTAFNKDALVEQSNTIQIAANTSLDYDKSVARLPKIGMYKEEIQTMEAMLLNNRVDDGLTGEFTAWKLSQAIGAVARDIDEDRKRELHDIAGQIFRNPHKF